jgi:hypothetical protein
MSKEHDDLIQSVCEALKGVELAPVHPASLMMGNQVLSTGRAAIEDDRRGLFWPQSEITQDIPDHGVTLKMTGTNDTKPIKSLRKCDAQLSRLHYHFQLA